MTLAELAQRAGLPGLARWAGSEGRAAGSTLHDWDAGEGTETAIRAPVREACRHTHRGEIAAMPFRSNPPRPAPTATLFSPAAPPPIYFASGSNDAGEIEGFADIGQPVGITADRCAPNCLRALRSVADRSATPVFLDSGAFSEVTFPGDGPPVVVAPISDDKWRQRLDLYVTLAHVYGPRLYAVAPDRVGDQAVTLERMRRFAPEVRSVAELGAHILVPLQRGPMALADFHRAAADALGLPIEATVPAIPSKKRATDPDALLDYLRTARPRRIHFLGLGRDAPNAPRILEAVQRLSPGCQVFLDSVLVRAHVGWGKGGETPRRYTAALATVREELVDRTFEDERGLPGYTDNVAFLGEWASRPMLERIAAAAMIPPERRAAFYKHPTQFAQAPVDADLSTLAALGDAPDMTLPGDDPRWWDLPWFEAAVDAEWHAYRRKVEGAERKRRSVERAWGDPEE